MSEEGFKEAIKGAIISIVVTALIIIILNLTGNQDNIPLILGANALADIIIISEFEDWGKGYLIGWLIGSGILTVIGILDQDIFLLYLLIGVGIFFGKSKIRKKRRQRR